MRALLAFVAVAGTVAFAAVDAAAPEQVGFVGRTGYDPPANMRDVEAVDVDGDLDLDLLVATANYDAEFTYLFRNDGSGKFGDPEPVPTGAAYWIATAELDGVAGTDFAVAGQAPAVALNDGDGHFAIGPLADVTHMTCILATDVDGDGDIDLVGTGGLGEFVVAKNDGKGVFATTILPISSVQFQFPVSIAAFDLTGDGRPEILLPWRERKHVRILVNDGSGGFTEGDAIPITDEATSALAAEDLDGDGDRDLVLGVADRPGHVLGSEDFLATRGGIEVLRNDDGTFTPWQSFAVPAWPSALKVVDLNDDGVPDVIVSGARRGTSATLAPGVFVFLGDGERLRPPVRFDPPAAYATSFCAVGDLDGDERPDFVGTSLDRQLGVMFLSPFDAPGADAPVAVTPSLLRAPGGVDLAISGSGFLDGIAAEADEDLGALDLVRSSDASLSVHLDVPAGIGSSDRSVVLRNPDGKTAAVEVALRSLDVTVLHGAVTDTVRADRDRLTARGTATFNGLADVTSLDSATHTLDVRLGSGPDAVDVAIPAGSAGWRVLRSRQRWRGRGPSNERVTFTLDASGAYTLSLRRVTLPRLVDGAVEIALAVSGGYDRVHRGAGAAAFRPTRRGWRL